MGEPYPSVSRLHLHTPGTQLIYYMDVNGVERALDSGTLGNTALTKFFRLCRSDAREPNVVCACACLYIDICKNFNWDKKKLSPRTYNIPCVGRIQFASIKEGERYFLRLLLTTVVGPQSYTSLFSNGGIVYATF